MKSKHLLATAALCLVATASSAQHSNQCYAQQILGSTLMNKVDSMACRVISSGFNAGDGYGEVWIRDYNTFIELSMELLPDEQVRHNLNVFWGFQEENGEIVDGFIDIKKSLTSGIPYNYRHSKLEPNYAAHKNTVETDQETSLIQAIYKYVKKSGNRAYLNTVIGGRTVTQRMADALNYLFTEKYSDQYGLITGATTADWGDMQAENTWGVMLNDDTHHAIDIYDNAMLVIALDNYVELLDGAPEAARWKKACTQLRRNIRKHLWDKKKQKFIPHIYLNGSPFPDDFDENQIYYHGGTAVAIQAGLLSKKEIREANARMLQNVKDAGAQTIGLTMYPAYPTGMFKGIGMDAYCYQNGGDWTWFGGRMIHALIDYGMIAEAYDELQPMLQRVIENNGFHEWYTPAGQPMGSGTFRGEAGVLHRANAMLRQWARQQQ